MRFTQGLGWEVIGLAADKWLQLQLPHLPALRALESAVFVLQLSPEGDQLASV